MGMGGQHHAPAALPPGKGPSTNRIGGWVGPRACLDGCGRSFGFRVTNVCNHGEHYETPCTESSITCIRNLEDGIHNYEYKVPDYRHLATLWENILPPSSGSK
jgi:hypothetical protein